MGLIDRITNSALHYDATSLHCVHFLDELLKGYPKNDLQIRLWDGAIWGSQTPRCTVILKHPGTLRRLCTQASELSLAEAYIYDDVEVEGEIEAVFELADHFLELGSSGHSHRLQLLRCFRDLPHEDDSPMPRQDARKLLGPLHSKKRANALDQQRSASFIDRYVFPDGDLVPISVALAAAEGAGFEVRDIENLREHYGLTLRRWVRRVEQHADVARRLTDETTYRIWRLYMAGSAQRFLSGRLNSYHTLLLKGLSEDVLPPTRDGRYHN